MTSSYLVPTAPSSKSRSVTLALAVLLGPFGAHRFYVGKTGTGLLMLGTLGGAGIWYLYDLILVIGGAFRDSENRLVTSWDSETEANRPNESVELNAEVLEELSTLRSEVAELAERLDFAERLLAQPRPVDRDSVSPLKS
jgi:TM2 domain-containing membrane protein YozV